VDYQRGWCKCDYDIIFKRFNVLILKDYLLFFFQRVNITVLDFDLEDASNCYWDALAFNDTGTNITEVSVNIDF